LRPKGPRRRLRVRRKREGESLAVEAAKAVGEEVVFQAGCCLVEAVLTAGVVVALVSLPAYFAL
jgi:hypothetical protein